MGVSQYQKAVELLAFEASDENFFDQAAEALAIATGYRWAVIFSLLPTKDAVKALSFWTDGKKADTFQFSLPGTPCEKLYEQKHAGCRALFINDLKCNYPSFTLLDASCYQAALFFDTSGEPLGHIATLNDKTLPQTEDDRHFFHLLAQRIGAKYGQVELKKALTLRSQMIDNTSHLMSFVDSGYIYRVVSGGFEKVLGMPREDIIGRSVSDIYGQKTFETRLKDHLDCCLAGEALHTRSWITPMGKKSLFVDSNLTPCRDDKGNIIGVIVSSHDITEDKLNEDRMVEFAHLDPLTGLPNRRYLFERLGEELAKYKRRGNNAVVFYIDLDGFKHINDSKGHVTGDKVLEIAAQRLRHSVREEDTLARIGGDEFVLLATGSIGLRSSISESRALAQKILSEISEPMQVAGTELKISASIGIHPIDRTDKSVDDIISKADIAMYQAKQNGRNQMTIG